MGERSMNRVLMVAYHFPPFKGGSGVHRTLQFVRYLPEHNWEPIVLTPTSNAYATKDTSEENNEPLSAIVHRSFALDTARHLSLWGRYLRCTALPDRWISWFFTALPKGLLIIRRYRPQILWSTYPVATAHLIGYALSRLTGLPWIADFRDPLGQTGYPADPLTRKAYWALERGVIHNSQANVFTTQGTLNLYQKRYTDVGEKGWSLIPNGFDESVFQEAESLSHTGKNRKSFLLVHSGLLYPSERNPEPFFKALAAFISQTNIQSEKLEIVLRGSGNEANYKAHLGELGLENHVFLKPGISYRQAIAEMLDADGLLLFQGTSCNQQIPAKAYEYIRAGKPILALTDPDGDTARLLHDSGAPVVMASMHDSLDIYNGLLSFLDLLRNPRPEPETDPSPYSRRSRTAELAALLERVSQGESP